STARAPGMDEAATSRSSRPASAARRCGESRGLCGTDGRGIDESAVDDSGILAVASIAGPPAAHGSCRAEERLPGGLAARNSAAAADSPRGRVRDDGRIAVWPYGRNTPALPPP